MVVPRLRTVASPLRWVERCHTSRSTSARKPMEAAAVSPSATRARVCSRDDADPTRRPCATSPSAWARNSRNTPMGVRAGLSVGALEDIARDAAIARAHGLDVIGGGGPLRSAVAPAYLGAPVHRSALPVGAEVCGRPPTSSKTETPAEGFNCSGGKPGIPGRRESPSAGRTAPTSGRAPRAGDVNHPRKPVKSLPCTGVSGKVRP